MRVLQTLPLLFKSFSTIFFISSFVGAENFKSAQLIDLNPPVKSLSCSPISQSVSCLAEPNEDILENGWMRVVFSHSDGFQIREIKHKSIDKKALAGITDVFNLEIDKSKLGSSAFKFKTKEILELTPEKCEILYLLQNTDVGLEAAMSVRMNRTSELNIVMSLKNISSKPVFVKAAFPFITGIKWSSDQADDYYLFPFCTGVISNRCSNCLSPYAAGQARFQQMISYSPKHGGGLYLRVNDQTGEYKTLHLTKTSEAEPQPKLLFESRYWFDAGMDKLERQYSFFDALPKTLGTSMTFSYQGRQLEPGESWIFPMAVLGVMNGDWHQAMASYRQWYESWSFKRPYPNKLTEVFNLEGISSAYHYHDANGYNTDIRRHGHLPMTHVGSRYWSQHTPDILEHNDFWEWDELTDEYTKSMQEITQKYGKEFKSYRSGVIEGKNYSRVARNGDYGLTGYNERWGGLPAFRKYLHDMKNKGITATLYINEGEAGLNSIIGKKYGPDWCIMLEDGSYHWPFFMWEMCINNPLWRQYLADTCKRLIAETRADGIRIDEFGGVNPICHNPKHSHTFSRPGQSTTLQAQTQACREIRMAVDQVDPDAVLMVENAGMDTMWQYLDGTLSYDLCHYQPLTGILGDWEGFVGIDINRFYFPRFKIFDYQVESKYPAWRFFNATGAMNREWFYENNELQILKENSDAFGSLDAEPMIPTLLPMVYANKFPANNKILYTVYNATNKAVSGNLMALDNNKDWHIVDLYRFCQVKTTTKDDRLLVGIDLPPRSVTCMAYLPEVLNAKSHKRGVKIKLQSPIDCATVKLVDPNGTVLAQSDISGTECILQLPANTGQIMYKLYSGKYLIDGIVIDNKK